MRKYCEQTAVDVVTTDLAMCIKECHKVGVEIIAFFILRLHRLDDMTNFLSASVLTYFDIDIKRGRLHIK